MILKLLTTILGVLAVVFVGLLVFALVMITVFIVAAYALLLSINSAPIKIWKRISK